MILVLEKARSHRVVNPGGKGSESPQWFDVCQKTPHKMWFMTENIVVMKLPVTSCPSPGAHSCSLLSTEKYSSVRQNLMQMHCSTQSFWMSQPQYTCSLNSIYCPHWLVQWSHQCSHMCIPVHSPWLPGYRGFAQTILVILTMAGLFPDRPHVSPHLHAIYVVNNNVE